MRSALFLLLVALAASGCIRTYRMEHACGVDTGISTDGTFTARRHAATAEREWRGLWPLPPSCLQP